MALTRDNEITPIERVNLAECEGSIKYQMRIVNGKNEIFYDEFATLTDTSGRTFKVIMNPSSDVNGRESTTKLKECKMCGYSMPKIRKKVYCFNCEMLYHRN